LEQRFLGAKNLQVQNKWTIYLYFPPWFNESGECRSFIEKTRWEDDPPKHGPYQNVILIVFPNGWKGGFFQNIFEGLSKDPEKRPISVSKSFVCGILLSF
jgi:hypothetical protein